MKTPAINKTKTLFALFLLLAATQLQAQNVAGNKVKCSFSIPVNQSVSNEQAYEIATQWFTKNTAQLTRSNISAAAQCAQCTNTSNLAEINHEFDNSLPVQSLDPASNRFTAKVVTKYFGTGSSTIHALYLQYYLVVTVAEHQIICEIKDIRYNHFNEHNYQFKRIQNWGNSTSLDPVNTFEYLVENEQSHEEFNKFYAFFNSELNQIVGQFGSYVSGTLSQN